MARKIIDTGSVGNDGTGDSIRDSFRKVNDNFRELYSSLGLGERLSFIGLDDVSPSSYEGQVDGVTGSTPVVTINNTANGVTFKRIVPGVGIGVDYTTNDNEIRINSEFAEISADSSPQLGGDLSVQSGGNQYRIQDLVDPITADEAARKGYVDTKVSRAGVDAVDPATGLVNSAFGRMSGPLILSRSPEAEDDQLYDGLIAATKAYVDSSSFGSSANLYVATSGNDAQPGISRSLQGRALAYAFRTIEEALKRAEELINESRVVLGPYKKVLTYDNGTKTCTLSSITTSPTSGSGFSGTVAMSVDTASLTNIGTNYFPGDIITITGGTVAAGGEAARIEVLTTATTPGAISTFRILNAGSYTALPGSTLVAGTITTAGNPAVGGIGTGARFTISYRVGSVDIVSGGSGYSLVSVRITGGGGSGAFGTANVTAGVIDGITITDPGSGFTSLPTLVADLPRFSIKTEGLRTDFTGDVLTDTQEAIRGRDIREGLFLKGETSGALAQILAHDGSLDSEGNEIFDVDIKFGAFELDEAIAYGDVSISEQITVLVESGTYEENYPLKVPQNVAIVGDEFRRVIIRPKAGVTSSSPWAFQKFRRDLTIDNLSTATQLFGYHYLEDPTQPVYPKIDNEGNYDSAAQLIELNRSFLQEEVIAWINQQIEDGTAPFTTSFEYNSSLCKRDVGLIIDALLYDIKYSGYDRTISAGLKYYESASGRIAITTQLSETLAGIDKLRSLIASVLSNSTIDPLFQEVFPQIIDRSYTAESNANNVIGLLIDALKDVMDGSGSVNYPKDNDKMDVFLLNDAVIIRAVTCQGHGGFMGVLDPAGQILAKSPYFQECASFSRSIDAQIFAGGMFIDGFAGNLQFTHETTVAGTGNTRLTVAGLDRIPQLPCSFLVDDTVFRLNYIRDFNYDPAGSTATFVLDETNPFTRDAGAQTCTISVGTPAVITKTDHSLQGGATLKFTSTGTLPTGIVAGQEYYVMSVALTNNTFQITETFGSDVPVATTGAGSGTHSYQRQYELLMPGNRSCLANDFTQVNDMGYGAFGTNGGLLELVSMFTYYCYTSYYSLNGAQIRSIGGSSAHGIYALVAEGSDPLEVPTPTSLYHELSQRCDCYFPSPAYANVVAGLSLFVTNYDYVPLNTCELEVDHGSVIYRYPVTSVATEGLPDGVARLNLTSDPTGNFEGLFKVIPDGTKMTIRQGTQTVLTGGLVDVAVRPSTGLLLNESITDVYRVLQFEEYEDTNGPYPIDITVADPGVFKVLINIKSIVSDLITTERNHRLRLGDIIIPQSSNYNFVSGTTYYVVDVPSYNEFKVSATEGGAVFTLIDAPSIDFLAVKPHKLQRNETVRFNSFDDGSTTTVLPAPLNVDTIYYVLETGYTSTEFQISTTQNGDAIEITDAGTGDHYYYIEGLTRTNLRENYDYVDVTLWKPGEAKAGTSRTASISIGSPATITTTAPHSYSAGDVVKFETTGTLPTGIVATEHYHVLSSGLTGTEFRIAVIPEAAAGSVAVDTLGSYTGTVTVSKVTGQIGDSNFRVLPVGSNDISRLDGAKFVYNGEEYVISDYQSEEDLNEAYAEVNLDKPLVDNIQGYESSYTIKAGVPANANGAKGTLTIRISLTRVTGHDLLEIGTGSYADTNYPNEIYGGAVNALNPDTEVEERDVGRCFYVTTDQFGNFSVGPYFRVDQGTGAVTFASSIALSNLDGIGFKRGVPVSEFSTDSSFSDNATDTVPTENATRIYVERRLGLTHTGSPVVDTQLIPAITGGFMALDGQLAMKADMDLANNKIVNVTDATSPQDAVNLRSLTWDNFQDFSYNDIQASDIVVFTGAEESSVNATVVGDITFNLRTGVDSALNQIDVQINADTIINADVKSDAGILQSKLLMNSATTRANATGITQAEKGLASFDSAQFTATDGWLTVKNNGLVLSKIAQIATKTVLGNSTLATANVTAVAFSTVVNDGGAIKKNQYDGTGFLRRTSGVSFTADGDYDIIEATSNADASTLVERSVDGDFAGNVITASQLKIDDEISIDTDTTASGGFTRYYGYQAQGGILVGDGSLGTDKVSQYLNDSHQFKTQDGISDAPITASQIQVQAITTGGNTTAGTITGRWTLTGTSPNESRLQATYSADLAEYYEGDKEYEVGTVLVFGGDKEVTVTNKQADTRVAGVVSNTAAFAMYEGCPGLKNLVALQGRVPVKVVGKIEKGDLIVTSSIPGVAVSAKGTAQTGTVIGKALENYDSDHIGKIEVAVGRS